MRKSRPVQQLKFLVRNFLDREIPGQFLFLGRLRRDWDSIAGKSVGQHSLPVSLQRGTLTVAVDDPIWIQELSLQKDMLRDNIITHYRGEETGRLFQTIRFRLGDISRTAEQKREKARLKLPAETRAAIDKTVSAVEDPDLRKALRNYLVASSLILDENGD